MARTFALAYILSLVGCRSAAPQSAPAASDATGADAGSVLSGSGSGNGPGSAPDAGPYVAPVTDIDTTIVEDGVSCSASLPPPSFDVGCGTWTLEQPLPQAHALTSVWAAASDDVWAVGFGGAMVHWNGTSWTPLKSPTTANLYSVWGADAKHVWAGGVGVLLFFDGVAWSVDPAITQNINLITGSARDDVWIRTEQSLFHWDGARWTQPGSAVGAPDQWRFPIWPVGGGRAWGGGCQNSKGSLYWWDGTQWSRTDTDLSGCVTGIAGTSPTDIWASGSGESWYTLHWDGSRWSEADPGLPIGGGVFAPARGEVWLASTYEYVPERSTHLFARLESGAFHPFLKLADDQINYWTGFAAASPSDVTIVGSGGLLAHFDGHVIRVRSGPNELLNFIWEDGSGNAWAGNFTRLMRRQNGCWSTVHPTLPELAHVHWYRMSGSRPDDAWIMAGNNFGLWAVHWDGQSFSARSLPNKGYYYSAVWVSPEGGAFFAGDSGIYRADAVGFSQIDSPDPGVTMLFGKFGTHIWGTSDSDVWWLKGDSATGTTAMVHFDGSSAEIAGHLPWALWDTQDVQVDAPDDAWAIVAGKWGRPNTLEHFDGVSAIDVTPGPDVFSLAVRARDDVWAAAKDGLWHFDGRSWSYEDGPAGWVVATGTSIYRLGFGICRKP